LLHGEVLHVSQDAVTPENGQNPSKDQSRPDDIAPMPKTPNQNLAFAARVSLDRDKMQVDDRTVDLTPGMAATVEIKTGHRRVISFLLSPFMKYQSEALRER
jgi:hemolysin D